jgi:hypothetical protein
VIGRGVGRGDQLRTGGFGECVRVITQGRNLPIGHALRIVILNAIDYPAEERHESLHRDDQYEMQIRTRPNNKYLIINLLILQQIFGVNERRCPEKVLDEEKGTLQILFRTIHRKQLKRKHQSNFMTFGASHLIVQCAGFTLRNESAENLSVTKRPAVKVNDVTEVIRRV